MHSWGFALREGMLAETKEGKCKNTEYRYCRRNSGAAFCVEMEGDRRYEVF